MPGFLEFFFVHEHVSRYLTPSADREEVWWYFAAVFALGSLPWSLSALRIVATGWRRATPRGTFDAGLFLWIWIVFIIGFFSLSDSKLIPYILPVMPALALRIGALPAGAFGRDLRATGVLTLAAAAAMAAAALAGPHWIAPTERNHYFLMLAQPLGWIAALLAVVGLFGLLAGRRDATRAAVILGAGWCLSGLLLMQAAGLAAPIYSGAVLARAAAIPPGEPIYSVGTYDQTLPFYWRRTVKLAAYRGELDYGLKADPAAEIPSVAGFVAEWRGRPDGYAVMERSMFDDLQSARRADARSRPGRAPRAGGAAMSWVTWALILSGVGLNAAAQLLLKVATRPLAHVAQSSFESLRYIVGILGSACLFGPAWCATRPASACGLPLCPRRP